MAYPFGFGSNGCQQQPLDSHSPFLIPKYPQSFLSASSTLHFGETLSGNTTEYRQFWLGFQQQFLDSHSFCLIPKYPHSFFLIHETLIVWATGSGSTMFLFGFSSFPSFAVGSSGVIVLVCRMMAQPLLPTKREFWRQTPKLALKIG